MSPTPNPKRKTRACDLPCQVYNPARMARDAACAALAKAEALHG